MKTKIFLISTLMLPLLFAVSIIVSQSLYGLQPCNGKLPDGTFTLCPSAQDSGCDQWDDGNLASPCLNKTGIYAVMTSDPNEEFPMPHPNIGVNCTVCVSPPNPNSMAHCVIKKYPCAYYYWCKAGENGHCAQGTQQFELDENGNIKTDENGKKIPKGAFLDEAVTESCDISG
jgi:hypothetical protein